MRIESADAHREREAVQDHASRAHVSGITAVERAGEEQRVEALVLGRGRRGGQGEQQSPQYGAPTHRSILGLTARGLVRWVARRPTVLIAIGDVAVQTGVGEQVGRVADRLRFSCL